MIEVCSLSSGSNGNAFFIKTGADSFLVDAGISCKQICLRLEQIGVSPGDLKAIFITHEHSDHVRGLRVFLKRFPVPVYMTQKTYDRIEASIAEPDLHFINAEDTIELNDTVIRSLPKNHDAVDPTLFSFFYKGKKISIITDAGCACPNVVESVKDADILFLESNYDDEMLRNGIYPQYLKRRIAGNYGHLSNNHAGSLILDHASANLKHVFLSHLSENNNTPETALQTFLSIVKERDDLQGLDTIVTSRYEVSRKIRFDLR